VRVSRRLLTYVKLSTTKAKKMNFEFYILVYFDRFAEKYNMNGTEYRTLTKVYGLRFVLSIRGKGRRFDVVRLFVAIGMCSFFFV
jgi:hypothetical protein